jgi:GNAT superfamily N-acetyltransferase
MEIKDQKVFVDIARGTGVFREMEMDILAELVECCATKPDGDYKMLVEKNGEKITGFAIFGRVPLTDLSWDIYWLVVDKAYQGKGLAKKIMKRIEQYILGRSEWAVLRVETSSRPEYSPARAFYLNQGFAEAGSIQDFYAPGDGINVYSKQI